MYDKGHGDPEHILCIPLPKRPRRFCLSALLLVNGSFVCQRGVFEGGISIEIRKVNQTERKKKRRIQQIYFSLLPFYAKQIRVVNIPDAKVLIRMK
jgi:hypothetical protein